VRSWCLPSPHVALENRDGENAGGEPKVVEMKMQNWTRMIKTCLSVGLVLAASGHFYESVSSAKKSPFLRGTNPAQESSPGGLRVLEEACVQCHGLELIFRQQKTAESWRESIVLMMWRGAPLLPGEAEIIQEYLVSDFGRNLTPSSTATSVNEIAALPEGPGKTLVAEACAGCHDLSPIFAARRNGADWRRIVEEMVRLGSPLSGSEPETVIDYLTTSVAP